MKKLDLIEGTLKEFKDIVILEFGVNRGGSTKMFLNFLENNNGKLFSIDIKDCSNVSESKNFRFFQSNDLHVEKIISKFPEIANKGIDVLYIDSYHDPSHVYLLLSIWFKFVNKNGYIFFDDTDSYPYRIKKIFTLSVINDAISKVIKRFYHSNHKDLFYTKYYIGSGLSKFKKLSDKGSEFNLTKKLWKYNFFLSKIYIFLKKINYKVKNYK
jgi:predicted O-methyltransferase YrrM